MQQNMFGNNSMNVSLLGFGAGHIGGNNMSNSEAIYILDTAFNHGITLFDTARGYGQSEERIGKFIKGKREQIILSTKVGYSIPGCEDWTYDIISAGIEHALNLLQTDYIDIVHLHSCPLWILQKHEVIDALLAMKEKGKIKVAAYSGENEELQYAIDADCFDSIQTSVNIFDQRGIDTFCKQAKSKQMGIIAKRPLGNCPWFYDEQPYGHYCEDYWKRMNAMGLDFEKEWHETALRFSAYHGNADSVIIGTGNSEHLLKNITMLEKGPLPEETVKKIRESFKTHDDHWVGLI
jgi:aryl-alcohol dehydrogenase-like predicted oxidoreductase